MACWLYVCGIGFCQKFLTDGHIPVTSISSLSHVQNASRYVLELVKIRLWDRVSGGYQIHDYLDFNEKSEHVKLRREIDRTRKLSERNPNGIHAESERSPAGVLARARAPHPIPSKEVQILRTQAPPAGNGNRHGTSTVPVIAKLVKEARKGGSSDEDLNETVKALCARNHIAYDSGIVLAAIHSANGQAKRRK